MVSSKHHTALPTHDSVEATKHGATQKQVKCTWKGDFTTYPALICPLCNGYQGLSGNGVIKKETEKEKESHRERGREERDRNVGGAG